MTLQQTRHSELPLVSVLITMYNASAYIAQTIKSLQEQTYPYFEIIVVDDGSTDNSVDVIQHLAEVDQRIRIFTPGRLGRGKALNYGLKQCQGEFVAINDADDLSHSERLYKEVLFLMDNPEYGLIGCQSQVTDLVSNETRITHQPTSDHDLRVALTKGSCFNHPEIMFRRNILEQIGGYDESRKFLFDRDIILRTAAKSKIAKLSEVLVTIHHHENRYFYHSYKGRQRNIQSILLQMKAIHMFGFPWKMYIRPIVMLAWVLIPDWLKDLASHSLREKIRKIIK